MSDFKQAARECLDDEMVETGLVLLSIRDGGTVRAFMGEKSKLITLLTIGVLKLAEKCGGSPEEIIGIMYELTKVYKEKVGNDVKDINQLLRDVGMEEV